MVERKSFPAPAAPPTAPASRPAAGVEEQAVVRFVETVAERAAAELAKRAAGRRGEPGEPGG